MREIRNRDVPGVARGARGAGGREERARKSAQKEQGVPEKRGRVYTAEYRVERSSVLMEFLLEKCHTSRNNVKSLLSGHFVLVNGSPVSRHDFLLAKDDEVKLSKYPVRGQTDEGRGAPKKKISLKVLYEDADFIAVDKPAGLLSIESDKDPECAFGYVLEGMRQENPAARPYILHRIDKETSGVLIFAKNVKIHSLLRMDWNKYVTLREYYALVEGKMEEKEGTIVSYLKENRNNLVYVTHDPSGQKAVTHYSVVRENDVYSLLRVRIDTGRKNQIRVQMREEGHPVVGDDKYGCNKNPIGRLGLHAAALEFRHPVTGEQISVTSPMPPSFRSVF